jgi:hypothetical protein
MVQRYFSRLKPPNKEKKSTFHHTLNPGDDNANAIKSMVSNLLRCALFDVKMDKIDPFKQIVEIPENQKIHEKLKFQCHYVPSKTYFLTFD